MGAWLHPPVQSFLESFLVSRASLISPAPPAGGLCGRDDSSGGRPPARQQLRALLPDLPQAVPYAAQGVWPQGSPAAGWSAGAICATPWGSVLGAHSRQHSPVTRGRAPLGGWGQLSGTHVHTCAGQQRSVFTVRPSGGVTCFGFAPPRLSPNSGSSPGGRCGKGCLWPGLAGGARSRR